MSIPAHVSVSRAVSRGERFADTLSQAQLPRLSDFTPLDLRVTLEFASADVGAGRLAGQIEGALQLQCQLCLARYAWSCAVTVDLAVVTTEEEESRLMRDCEPLLALDDHLNLLELVEDEVLLALPLLRRCCACENKDSAPTQADAPETTRPLAALKNLKLKS